MIITIIILAVLLVLLMFRPRRRAEPEVLPVDPRRDDRDAMIFGETPGGLWPGGAVADAPPIEPGGGDFGGGGASGDWNDSSDSSGGDSSD